MTASTTALAATPPPPALALVPFHDTDILAARQADAPGSTRRVALQAIADARVSSQAAAKVGAMLEGALR